VFRGFCYVRFASESTIKAILAEAKGHFIRDRKVDIKEALSKNETKSKNISEKERKVFITSYKQQLNRCIRYLTN